LCQPSDLLVQRSGNEDLFVHQHQVDSKSIPKPINEFDLLLGTREVKPVSRSSFTLTTLEFRAPTAMEMRAARMRLDAITTPPAGGGQECFPFGIALRKAEHS